VCHLVRGLDDIPKKTDIVPLQAEMVHPPKNQAETISSIKFFSNDTDIVYKKCFKFKEKGFIYISNPQQKSKTLREISMIFFFIYRTYSRRNRFFSIEMNKKQGEMVHPYPT
jgi:hypothetical protein